MLITPLNSIYYNVPTKNKSLLTFSAEAEKPQAVSETEQRADTSTDEAQSEEQPKKKSYLGVLASLVVIGAILLLLAKAISKGEGKSVVKDAEEGIDRVATEEADEINPEK